MTAIVAVLDDGKVWMGGDSAGVAGLSLSLRSDPKVFRLGEFLTGYTGSFRMAQILRYHVTPPVPKEQQDGFEYMVRSFVPEIRTQLKTHGYLKTQDGREEIGTFLVGWRGRLYHIENDLQVREDATPYAACGCGADLSLGSLHTTEQLTGLTTRDRIVMALEAAEAFSAGVRGPYTVISR